MAETAPAELSEERRRTLVAVLDAIIPPRADGVLPGAGALGLAAAVWESVAANAGLLGLVAPGLDAVAEQARAKGAEAFDAVPAGERRGLLDAVSAAQPAFLPPLVLVTFSRYYQHPTVLEGLGLEARPPYPKGYEVPETDFGKLEAVRARGPIYRTP